MIYDDYIEYTHKYEALYGKKHTLVLMEVGSFFEIYAIDNDTEKAGPDIYTVCDLLNLQVSRKNKSILENSRTNPLMAGFPSHSLSKHVQVLLSNQYTVVLIRQVTPPPNPQREVTEILSPSMQLQPTGMDGNFLMVAYWDVCADGPSISKGKRSLCVGIACVDVSTGYTFAYEIASTSNDPNLSIDEFVRMFQTYQPRELVLIGSGPEREHGLSPNDIDMIETAVGVRYDTSRSIHRLWNMSLKEYTKIRYQNAVLRKAYPALGMLDPTDALHLERLDNARTAFVYMIQFGYEHSESIISCLRPPEIFKHHVECKLEYNSAVQLNVISAPGSHDKPLMSWLNRCATSFGARRFRERLLQPIRDPHVLQERYARVEHYMTDGRYKYIHATLKNVMDLERMIRRMKLGSFAPLEWAGFHASLTAIQKVHATEGDEGPTGQSLQRIMDGYDKLLRLDECSKYILHDIRTNIFQHGIYEDIDQVQAQYEEACSKLEQLATIFQEIPGADANCKVEFNERDGYSITTTKRKYQVLDTYLASQGKTWNPCSTSFQNDEIDPRKFSSKPISSTSSTVRIKHPWIEYQSDCILKTSARLQQMVTRRYKEFLSAYSNEWCDALHALVEKVADLDIHVTCAKNATEYGYNKPMLEDAKDGSFVAMEGMRHPILERILEQEMYVPNDVCLGNEHHGLLLFGINASGKSSLMKAVGLNVLMAQAGMFVAASKMRLAPYGHIFTRIAGMDNIFKGWSTFTVEMLELKNILHRCDRYSLVLGDELCSGTESVSALAIVTAGIEKLRERGSSFIFATHLHDLSHLSRITEMSDICMQHMHIEIDSAGKITYDRRLREGSGSALYGLEVCKGLGLPPDFLKTAHDVRCQLQGVTSEFQSPTKSRYNARVLMHECRVCGSPAKETHHMGQQKDANPDTGLIANYYHKNRAFNLVCLCEACHDKVHRGELEMDGYVKTTEGTQLKVRKKRSNQQTEDNNG